MANNIELVGDPVYDQEEGQFDDVEEEEVAGDTCTFLMLRRNCLAPKSTKPWQRTSLFNSTCTVKGKVCRFVVDSGCSANLVSEEAVRKLSLTAEAHPHPYRFLWMQTGAEVHVSQRALLTLSIGAFYKDSLYCDIAPMDVSHIILGRPWQFDREVMHNGKLNTYSFLFQGRRITLLPSPEPDRSTRNPSAEIMYPRNKTLEAPNSHFCFAIYSLSLRRTRRTSWRCCRWSSMVLLKIRMSSK